MCECNFYRLSGDGAGESGCIDIDECLVDNGGCHSDAICTNIPGANTCACKPGYLGNGVGGSGCVDINECGIDYGGCNDNSICQNVPGLVPSTGVDRGE